MARSNGVLSKVKHTLPKTTLLQLYCTLVHPVLLYGITAWGNTFPTYLQKLQVLQNKAVRLISESHPRDHLTSVYASLKILQVKELLTFELAKFVFCCIANKAPKSFSEYFVRTSEVSCRNTRQSQNKNNLYTQRYRSNRLQRCKFQVVKVWENIPNEHKENSYGSFKKRLQEYLHAKC